MNETTTEHGNYRETDESVRGLATYAQAQALLELMLHKFEQQKIAEDCLLRVDERRLDGLFDVIVLKRVN